MSICVDPLLLAESDRAVLEGWVRASTVESGLARRARIVLLASEQRSNTEIALLVGVSRPTVLLWRGRYGAGGLAALRDLDRPGRPRTVSAEQVVVAMTRLSQVSTMYAAGSRQAEASAQELAGLAASMQASIETFRTSSNPDTDTATDTATEGVDENEAADIAEDAEVSV